MQNIPSSKPSILVVDDSPENIDVLKELLKDNYTIRPALTGALALKIATATPRPDLILLDVMMPDMDGYEVMRRLQASEATHEIPVIFVTALSDEKGELKGLELGAVDYITKPINPPIVKARIKTHLALREAIETARLANQAKDAFLANMSHELRTPLNAVIGLTGLARALSTDPRQRDYLDKVVISGKHLNRIIDDLLDLSKIAAGHLEFETIAFRLSALLRRCNSSMAHRATEKGLVLVEKIDATVPDVFLGDPLRIEQILINLVGNAIKFTPSGQIKIHVRLRARKAHRVCLEIEVEDSGIGMSPEDLERLFKPFSQADATVCRKFGGSGLGLAISKQLAELMDGDIDVTSREGIGTSFRVRLWLGQGEAGELPPGNENEKASVPAHYEGVRVLVVDDQPFNRDVAEGLLAAVGITPYPAQNGQEALDILTDSKNTFDLILMDIQMPIMDGLTATRTIRKLDGFAQLPIIAMTGHTMAHERERSVAAGMSDHLGKPFDEAGFYRVLAKWIPQSKQRQHAATKPHPEAEIGFPHLHGIDTRTGLALLQGSEARYRHWLIDFVTEAPTVLTQIRQSLAAGETEPASMAAHMLRGRTGLLGMKQLHAGMTALETAIENTEPTDELLHRVDQDITTICEEIQRGLGTSL